jgi:chemotaxis protein methyltransferase CheR
MGYAMTPAADCGEYFDFPGLDPVAAMTNREFQQIAGLARTICGIDLSEGKQHMLSSRLLSQVREMRCRSFSEYYEAVTGDRSGGALSGMIDALTTNVTAFMREPAHFAFLKKTIAPRLRNGEPIRVWSAGAATGEEAYSIALCLIDDAAYGSSRGLNILASDISNRALWTASQGIYRAEKLRTLGRALIARHFVQGDQDCGGWYRVKSDIRRLIAFQRINLVEPFPRLGQFSVVFCRNVMIYFDRRTQLATIQRLFDCIEPGGYLLVGHSESLVGAKCPMAYVCPSVYRKEGRGAAC